MRSVSWIIYCCQIGVRIYIVIFGCKRLWRQTSGTIWQGMWHCGKCSNEVMSMWDDLGSFARDRICKAFLNIEEMQTAFLYYLLSSRVIVIFWQETSCIKYQNSIEFCYFSMIVVYKILNIVTLVFLYSTQKFIWLINP